MPYIPKSTRIAFASAEREIAAAMSLLAHKVGPGGLNYLLTVVIREYLISKGTNYATVNDILGALSGAKSEFYRRVAAPYEDKKILENGDVY